MQYSPNSFLVVMLGCVLLLGSCKDRETARQDSVIADNDTLQTYQNPVYQENFPDPTIIQAPDGTYYAYGTNSKVGDSTMHLQVLRSSNLVDWHFVGDGMPDPPVWADRDFWAPHVFYDPESQQYFLYYSGESTAENMGKCLGVAVADHPEGPFVDKGEPLLCGDGFINIDPMLFNDPQSNKFYLYWGSGHQPIKVREMADNLLEFKEGSAEIAVIDTVASEDPDNYSKLVEAPWVHVRDGYYFLFYSGDNCCGEQAHYALMVARSESPTGPFMRMEESDAVSTNSVILGSGERWLAPGHNSIFSDDDGKLWTFYHAIDAQVPERGRLLMVDPITFKNNWPEIPNSSPSQASRIVPVVQAED